MAVRQGTVAQDQAAAEFDKGVSAIMQDLAQTNQRAQARYQQFETARTQVRQWLQDNQTQPLNQQQFQDLRAEYDKQLNAVVDAYLDDLKKIYGMT